MTIEMDNKSSLIKIYWVDIREHVSKVEPMFVKIVDELQPDQAFPLYLAYYPYGALVADTQSAFLPSPDGSLFRLTDPNINADILKHLGYAEDSLPMGMVLEKQLEYFIDLPLECMSIPWMLCGPGSFFPFATILGNKGNWSYAPNSVLSTTAGVRSTFMLPNIGCVTNHLYLQRDFKVQQYAPKSLYEHWNIFKEIVNSKLCVENWRCCILYFSEIWVKKIHTDKAWLKLKSYLFELGWHRFAYDRNRVYYDIAFSLIQKKRNLKPNPYIADTAKHLFSIALGAAPGYAPAINEDSLPVKTLQEAFLHSYHLKKYIPTIMQPKNCDIESADNPVYYSFQYPSTYSFSPKSRKISSTLFDMRELEHVMHIFIDELSREKAMFSGTLLSRIATKIEFQYFHNENDNHHIIKSSRSIVLRDESFLFSCSTPQIDNALFASDAKFVRGCVSIRSKG